MVYDTSSRLSLQYFHDIYDKIPLPQPIHKYEAPRRRGIQLEASYDSPYYPAERFPVVVAGYRGPSTLPPEVNESDVEKFIQDRPECIFGGEFALDNQEEIDAIFLAVIGVIHKLKKGGAVPPYQVIVCLLLIIVPNLCLIKPS
jgi:hypothetical protein